MKWFGLKQPLCKQCRELKQVHTDKKYMVQKKNITKKNFNVQSENNKKCKREYLKLNIFWVMTYVF